MRDHPVILVAEDESIIGHDLCDTVEEAGYIVEGPHDNVSSAMRAVQENRPDLAILDIQLDDGVVYPLAQRLMEEDVPVIFHSGQVPLEEMTAMFPNSRALEKPCPPADMLGSVAEALADA
jgi:DNA-binding response OmpR family regulator